MRQHKLRINGKEVTPQEFHKRKLKGTGTIHKSAYGEDRPWISQSVGCMPHQVAEMRQVLKQQGIVGVDVLDDGRVSCTCRGKAGISGRNAVMALRGLHDNDGGYGDG